MRIRLTKVDEYQFLTCVQHGLWGSKSARFKKWNEGDYLAIIVDKEIAGLALVKGGPFQSQTEVWDNGLYPHRIRLDFKYLFENNNRPQILGPIRDTLVEAWTTKYGWGILNQEVLENSPAEKIMQEIKSRPNNHATILENLDTLLFDAKQKRELQNQESEKKRESKSKHQSDSQLVIISDVKDTEELTDREESIHSKAQYFLAKIGAVTGCDTFIASNDRNRRFNNVDLGSLSVKSLPKIGLDKEVTDRISLIDVIWLKQNAPICAFEVETSTSVYSGLLRMADLLAVVPVIKIKLYIVAQRERENKVLKELSRPTFRKIGLNDYCQFIPIEDLEDLMKKVNSLSGHVQHSILDTVSIGLEDEENNES